MKLIRARGVIWTITLPFAIGIRTAHNFAKVQLLKAYLAVHKFGIVCFSKTHLNSGFPLDDDNLNITGYIMVRADHRSNSKRGGVCMHYKSCLPLKALDIRFLHESIGLNLRIGDKLCSSISLYRSPNQSYGDFVSFLFTDHLTNHMMILYRFSLQIT